LTIKQVFVFKTHEPPDERIKALPFKKIRFLFEKAENGFLFQSYSIVPVK